MSVLGVFGTLYPEAGVDDTRLSMLETITKGFRPRCLSADMQDLAQAYYIAYVLETEEFKASNGESSRILVEEAEADVRKRWQVVGSEAGGGAPMTPYAMWKALNDRCKRRGAIVMAANPCP